MAQLLIIQSGDINSTERTLNQFTANAVKLPHEKTQIAHIGELSIGIVASEAAPVFTADIAGDSCWLMGRPDLPQDDTHNYANLLLTLFQSDGLQGVAALTGYFVCVIQTADAIHIFTDLLGLFPVYWDSKSVGLTVGTSARSISCAGTEQPQFDPVGVVGHLMLMHEFGNKSLYQGVQRLPAGSVLTRRAEKTSVEHVVSIPIGTDYFDAPFEQHIALMSDAMAQAINEHGGHEISSLFSGGLDSRLIAGYLQQKFGNAVTAYTFGDASDIEFKCAQKITQHLGWEHLRMEINYENYPRYSEYQLDRDQAANGFNDLAWWEFSQQAEARGQYMPTGFLGDSTMGGSHISWGYSEKDGSFSLPPLKQRVLEWGIGESNLRRILHPDVFNEVYPKVLEAIDNSYHELPGEPFQKVWQFDLKNRQRYHVAGSARRMQNMSWPTFPMAHHKVLHAAGNMPCDTLLHRRLQREMLKQLFPDLARFPLDNFTHFPEVLLPTRSHIVMTKIKRKVHRFNPMRKLKETRYYYRTYDINNDGWQSVRSLLDSNLQNVSDLFVMDEIATLLKQPEDKIVAKNAVRDVAGLKTLLAITLLGQSDSRSP